MWCMDLAKVANLAKHQNSVKFILSRLEMFGRAVDANGKKTKQSKEPVTVFSTIVTKNYH